MAFAASGSWGRTAASPASPVQDQQNAAEPANADPSVPATHPSYFADALAVAKGSNAAKPGAATELSEERIRQVLQGKMFFLRGEYLDNTLNFDEHGRLLSHSPRGSYTLSVIKVNKAKLEKHRLEIDGDRYALHFQDQSPYDDQLKDADRVKITPKKKYVKITIDREELEKPKKEKGKGKHKDHREPVLAQRAASAPDTAVGQVPESQISEGKHGVTRTTSAAEVTRTLADALDHVFAYRMDDGMIASMPDLWQLYFKAAIANKNFKPADSDVFDQNAVDQKARLISAIEPASNQYAQAAGVAGLALYHAVIGSDGKVQEVVAGRPIGFGLDENAADTIRKATFQPALKDGKPVPVALDLIVSFRIYSKRTSEPTPKQSTDGQQKPVLPGPYTVQEMSMAH